MAEFAQAQQAAADSVNKIGMRATFVCHLPSSIAAADGLLLTTYDQLYSHIAKADTTVYAFPTFRAAQSVMRALKDNQQNSSLIYECHANADPVEIAARKFLIFVTSIKLPYAVFNS